MALRVLTLLHTNDFHGHVTAWHGWEGDLAGKQIGGFDRLAAAIRQVRAEVGPECLLLDAGDAIGDTLLADATEGRALITLMNALGYDGMTIGNHEPDFGIDVLRQRIQEAHFPVLAANLTVKETGLPFTQKYRIFPTTDLCAGVVGLTYPNTPWTGAGKKVEGLLFDDPAASIRSAIPQMRTDGAEVIIVLSHLGLGADIQLAQAVPGIDVIVGGHSHNRMADALRVGETLIVQAGAHCSDLGRLDLRFDSRGYVNHQRSLLLLDNALIEGDKEIAGLVSSLSQSVRQEQDEILCQAPTAIPRAQTLAGQQPRKRDAESPADLLFADIIREKAPAEIALLPGVGYGVAIGPGAVTTEDLKNLLPHASSVVSLTLTGAQIEEILEQSLENTYTDNPQVKVGGLIQTSGLTCAYNEKASANHRVVEISIGGYPLDREKEYRVVTNGMMADGGHHYRTFLQGKHRQEQGKQFDWIRDELRQRRTVTPPPIGRIHRISH